MSSKLSMAFCQTKLFAVSYYNNDEIYITIYTED